jgi:carbon monoxide dehydrogenase subunit G
VDLTHTFTVPVDKATTWAAFEDITSVAECFPGAAVTSVSEDGFEGTCKVKLGPIALQYSGQGIFVERDQEAGQLRLEAKGRDKRGNGTAGANVTATFVEVGPTETRVDVVTDLQITGKPAQFGRGVMQDVSDKLLGQFVECLRSKVAAPPEPAVVEGAAPFAQVPSQPTGSEAGTSRGTDAGSGAGNGSDRGPDPAPEPPPVTVPPRVDDSVNLMTTLLPVLVRTAWKPAAAVLLVLLVLRWLLRRR